MLNLIIRAFVVPPGRGGRQHARRALLPLAGHRLQGGVAAVLHQRGLRQHVSSGSFAHQFNVWDLQFVLARQKIKNTRGAH